MDLSCEHIVNSLLFEKRIRLSFPSSSLEERFFSDIYMEFHHHKLVKNKNFPICGSHFVLFVKADMYREFHRHKVYEGCGPTN